MGRAVSPGTARGTTPPSGTGGDRQPQWDLSTTVPPSPPSALDLRGDPSKGTTPPGQSQGDRQGQSESIRGPIPDALLWEVTPGRGSTPGPPWPTPLRTRGRLPLLTGVAVGAEVAMAAAALARPDAHLVLLAGEVPLADGWTDGQMAGMSASAPGLSLLPQPPRVPRSREGVCGGSLGAAELWHCGRPGRQLGRLDGTLTRKMPPASGHPAQLNPCHQPPATQPSPVPTTGCAPQQRLPLSSVSPAEAAPGRGCLQAPGENGDVGWRGCGQPRAPSPRSPPCAPHGLQRYHCHPHHHLSRVGHQPPKVTSPSPAEGTLRWGGCPEWGRHRTWDRQHHGAGRRRQIPCGPGQASLATGRGRADHPSRPPYLGVLRPTVMDTIETPKIDRLHRLGAVSLRVRADRGGQGDGDRPPPAVLADPVLLPSCRHAEGTKSCSRHMGTQRMQRAVTRAHARWVSWLRGLRRWLQTAEAPGRCAEPLWLSWGIASPVAS